MVLLREPLPEEIVFKFPPSEDIAPDRAALTEADDASTDGADKVELVAETDADPEAVANSTSDAPAADRTTEDAAANPSKSN